MKRISFLLITGLLVIMLTGCKLNNTSSEVTSDEPSSSEYITGKDENMGDVTISSEEPEVTTESTPSIGTDSSYIVDWSDITVDGLDEDSFIHKLDTEVLQDVAAKLQSLVDEELAEEKENPEITYSEGFTRVFKKELYLEVIDMGNKAVMPLYYILYKSPNNGMYEFICAVALSKLTGFDFMNESGDYYNWASGKEYLELFNKYMLENPNL